MAHSSRAVRMGTTLSRGSASMSVGARMTTVSGTRWSTSRTSARCSVRNVRHRAPWSWRGQSAGTVSEVLAAFEGVVIEAVAGGDKVQLPGFLTFDRTERKARTGHNPGTGAAIQIPAATVPRVKAGKSFKDAVRT